MEKRAYKDKHLYISLKSEKQLLSILNVIRREYNKNIHQYEVVDIALNYLCKQMQGMNEKERRELLNKYWEI